MFLTDLADKLRAYKAADGTRLNVIEVNGWKYRTYDSNGLAGNVGVLWHHTATASASRYSEGAPTLNMCINGRSDLPGPLCNIVFGRNAEVYVIAGGEANHAGMGSINGAYANQGNYYLIAIEMESAGTLDDWTHAQRTMAPHLGAALDLAYSGGGDYFQLGHKEYSSQGKIDPAYWDMDAFRSDINKLLAGGSLSKPVAAETVSKPAPAGTAPYWVVEKGDTLSKIARYYYGEASKGTLDRLVKRNKLANANSLKLGQKVYIPGPLVWNVEPGDTWEKVAAYYGYDVAYLKSLNPVKGMTVGTVLTIYNG